MPVLPDWRRLLQALSVLDQGKVSGIDASNPDWTTFPITRTMCEQQSNFPASRQQEPELYYTYAMAGVILDETMERPDDTEDSALAKSRAKLVAESNSLIEGVMDPRMPQKMWLAVAAGAAAIVTVVVVVAVVVVELLVAEVEIKLAQMQVMYRTTLTAREGSWLAIECGISSAA